VHKRILIIDDDEISRTTLREIFKAEPTWEIVEASNGQDALDRLCDGLRPDLCLVDLVMPEVGGIELIRRIRRDPTLRALRVAVASGSRNKDQIVALAQLNISGYLLKPFDPRKTLATVQQLLAPPPPTPTSPPATSSPNTVLLAEDSEIERTALRDIFQSEPHWEIVEAKDGQEALNRLYAGLRPDLAIVDLRMPELDGYTLIQRIREDPALRLIKVLVLSGEHDREKVIQLARLQISGYLLKPINPAKVRAAIHQAMGLAQLA